MLLLVYSRCPGAVAYIYEISWCFFLIYRRCPGAGCPRVEAKRESHGQMWLAPRDEEPETGREETADQKQYIWLGPSWARPRDHMASVPRSDNKGRIGKYQN